MSNVYWILFVFVAYFAVLIGIAISRSRQMADMSDYVLGGRKIGAFTSAISAASSTTSGWTMLVFPALAFAAGLMHLWTVVSLVLGAWFAWTIMARRLRRYTMATENSLTVPEFLEKRFGDTSGALRTLTAGISLYFITLYVCSGLVAGAKLLEVVFDLDARRGRPRPCRTHLAGCRRLLHLHRRLSRRLPHRRLPGPDHARRIPHHFRDPADNGQ